MFSKESPFTVISDFGHQLLHREKGTYFIQYVLECDRYDSRVLVWAGIMHGDKTPLYIFEGGYITLKQYCREIFLDHVCLFGTAVLPDFLFLEDNACPHRNSQASNISEIENINCM